MSAITLRSAAVAVAATIWACAPAHAQQAQQSALGTLAARGKVVGPAQKPQPGVPVQVEGPLGKTVVFTDNAGEWSLYNLPAGRYVVKPIQGATADDPVEFTVRDRSALGKWFSDSKNAQAYAAPDIKVRAGATQN
jgi:hypothetical protein